MKFSALLAATIATSVIAAPTAEQLYTVELAPGETRQVTEAQKWDLRREGKNFFDITDFPDLSSEHSTLSRRAPTYPSAVSQQTAVKALIAKISQSTMKSNLETFAGFYNRYYKSTYGQQSATWLQQQIQSLITSSGASKVTVKSFAHSWTQFSIIATIPGKSTATVVLGAHQDSINLNNPSAGKAPGADDDGSGSITILEAFRALLTSDVVKNGQLQNTIEFHWYAAEEAGLLGSSAIFTSYKNAGRNVVAMLQQDMTGYIQGTLSAGHKESIGVITDYVNVDLTTFMKKVITAYCAIPYAETKCGYACSDHASANKAGYPSSFVTESLFADANPYIHTTSDTLEKISYSHAAEHTKMTIGFAYELASVSL